MNVLQLQAHGSKAGNLPLLGLIGKNHPAQRQCKKQHCHTGQADDDIHNGGIFFLLFLLSSGRHTASGSGSTPLRVRIIARGIRLPVLNLLEILCIIGILIGSSRHSHIICIGVGHFSLKIKLIPDGGGSVIRVFPVGCICPLIGFLVIDFLAVGLPVIGLLTVGFPGVGLTGIGRLTAGLLNVRLIGIGFLTIGLIGIGFLVVGLPGIGFLSVVFRHPGLSGAVRFQAVLLIPLILEIIVLVPFRQRSLCMIE